MAAAMRGEVDGESKSRPTSVSVASSASGDGLRWLIPVIGAVIALPYVVVMSRTVTYDWVPVSDHALEVLRMRDVGTEHTPLVGVYSRFGWNHPGPLFLWADAPFLRLFGTGGVLAATALYNLGWSLLSLIAARRLGGDSLVVVTGIGLALLAAASGPAILVDPWNPYVAAPALFCFLITLVAFSESGSTWAGVVAVIAGSYSLQSHLGTLPVVLAALGTAALWYWVVRPTIAQPIRTTLILVGTGVAAWSGPLIQQLTGRPGNLTQLASFAIRGSEEPNPDLATALGVAARELGLRPPWAGFREVDWFFVGTSPIWMLAVVPALLTAVALAARGDTLVRRTCAYAIVLHLAAIAAVTRTAGGFPSYVLRWSWAVGCFSATILAWGTWRAVSRVVAEGGARRGRHAPTVVLGVCLLSIAVLSLATTVAAGRDELDPYPRLANESDQVFVRLEPMLVEGATYNARWSPAEGFSAVATSVFTRLTRDGWDIRFPPESTSAVGSFRSGEYPEYPTLWLAGSAFPFDPPPGATKLASWGALTPEEEVARDKLAQRLLRDLGMDPNESQRAVAQRAAAYPHTRDAGRTLQDLLDRGETYTVYLVPPAA